MKLIFAAAIALSLMGSASFAGSAYEEAQARTRANMEGGH